jgi:hypothetical protein
VPAKDVESVKEIATLVVEPIVVDEVSLFIAGPVRVQGRCRNPSLNKGSIEVFFNGFGIPISFEVEDYKGPGKGVKGGLLGQDLVKIMIITSREIERKEMTNSRDLARLIGIWIPTRMIQWRIALRWILQMTPKR